MKFISYVITAASFPLMLTSAGVYAFGNSCKNVNFSVDNNYDKQVTVNRIELWSESEGRWLKDDIKNIEVPVGKKDFVIRKGENVEHAENDRITKMKIHYFYKVKEGNGLPADTFTAKVKHTSTSPISDPVCVANRWYKGTINAVPD